MAKPTITDKRWSIDQRLSVMVGFAMWCPHLGPCTVNRTGPARAQVYWFSSLPCTIGHEELKVGC